MMMRTFVGRRDLRFLSFFDPRKTKKKKTKGPLSPFGGERNQPKNAKKKERNFCSIPHEEKFFVRHYYTHIIIIVALRGRQSRRRFASSNTSAPKGLRRKKSRRRRAGGWTTNLRETRGTNRREKENRESERDFFV